MEDEVIKIHSRSLCCVSEGLKLHISEPCLFAVGRLANSFVSCWIKITYRIRISTLYVPLAMLSLPELITCKKVGFIVPSSNTAVEPITNAIFQSVNANITSLFTRIQVTTVGIDKKDTSRFSTQTIVEAARLLADARPDAILWNGTSGSMSIST